MREDRKVRPKQAPIRASAGFSMVEIMVGVLIGMVSAIVIMQVFALSEGQKRSAAAGSDAQTSGAIALQSVQRDVREAGYEMGVGSLATSPIGCNVTLRAGVDLAPMAPVIINPQVLRADNPRGDNSPDPNTDTLLVTYGSGNYAADGDSVLGPPAPLATGPSINFYNVRSPMAFATGDRIIPASAQDITNPCATGLTLGQVTTVPCAWSGTTLNCVADVNGDFPVTVAPAWRTASTVLYNLGPAPVIRAYAVRGGNLTVCDYMVNDCGDPALKNVASVWVPVANNIVSLKALYGRDTVVPTPAGQTNYQVTAYDQTTPTTACGWLRIPAVRLALVARSGQFEKGIVTRTVTDAAGPGDPPPNAPTWAGNVTNPIVMGPSAGDQPWKHYRYKVFETLVPIRTLTYAQVQPQC